MIFLAIAVAINEASKQFFPRFFAVFVSLMASSRDTLCQLSPGIDFHLKKVRFSEKEKENVRE